MPIERVPAEISEEVPPQIDAAFAWGRSRRGLPREFVDRVHHALEYTMERQGYDCCERDHRRNQTDRWLDQLREGTRFNEWVERLSGQAELTSEQETARKEAEGHAEDLLRSALSSRQLKELMRRDYFHVQAGKRRFRITRGRSHNIKEVDAHSRILRTLCAHPIERVPDADTMLAQKLLLETCPKEFLKLANVTRVPHHRRVLNATSRQRIRQNVANAVIEDLARQETRQAEETMGILEQAALDVTAGVQAVEAEPLTGNVRAA